jgi:hypothetical protein
MCMASTSSDAEDFGLDGSTGQEERALISLLHQASECLTAASFAIELMKTTDPKQARLTLELSNVLTRARELLCEISDLQRR